jgi:hypothetical protein
MADGLRGSTTPCERFLGGRAMIHNRSIFSLVLAILAGTVWGYALAGTFLGVPAGFAAAAFLTVGAVAVHPDPERVAEDWISRQERLD